MVSFEALSQNLLRGTEENQKTTKKVPVRKLVCRPKLETVTF
jgi:hypothetical protein